MGASASISAPQQIQIEAELKKPLDASDLPTFEDAKAEIVRLRAAIREAIAEEPAAEAAAS
jgi:hypothetical protein